MSFSSSLHFSLFTTKQKLEIVGVYCLTNAMYQRQQNTLYHKSVRFCGNNFLSSDWFTAYNRGKDFDLWWAGLTYHKYR